MLLPGKEIIDEKLCQKNQKKHLRLLGRKRMSKWS
jgi:hypothetical protein